MVQQLLMTPQLQQAIKLLQLSRLELVETLRQEVEENPMLEEMEPEGLVEEQGDLDPKLAGKDTEAEPPIEVEKNRELILDSSSTINEVNWDDYSNHYDGGFSFSREAVDPNRPMPLDFVSKKPNLQSHLRWQLAHLGLTDQEEEAGHFVIGNLNRHGFLEISQEDIVKELDCPEEVAARAIAIVQEMDPPGVGARDVKESLLLQLKRLDLRDPLAALIIKEHLHSLELKKHHAIARAVGRPLSDVQAAVEIITNLNPYPGTQYSDEETHYVIPDVYVHKVGDEYLIVLNDEGLPRLRVSPVYQEMLNSEHDTAKSTKNYIQEKLKNAVWLIKSIQQRQRTIYKVMESILKFQYDFFEKGVAHLKPLILKDVAEDIEMHESTISRVTTNKYVHTPQGIFELKYFFNTAIKCQGGDSLASESMRDRIRSMIKAEDPGKPLNDNTIAEIFARENIKLARRTVAKYREQLGILPAKFRRQAKT